METAVVSNVFPTIKQYMTKTIEKRFKNSFNKTISDHLISFSSVFTIKYKNLDEIDLVGVSCTKAKNKHFY